jgi:desampylase
MRVVSLRSSVAADVVAHARETTPHECCGLLLGHDDVIVDARRTRNQSNDPSRFVIDPGDHFRGLREARSRGIDVVGFYHSHPRSPAVPSDTDRREAGYPGYFYLIVSLALEPADARLYTLVEEEFVELFFVTAE